MTACVVCTSVMVGTIEGNKLCTRCGPVHVDDEDADADDEQRGCLRYSPLPALTPVAAPKPQRAKWTKRKDFVEPGAA